MSDEPQVIGAVSLAWFPRAERAAARERWPDLRDEGDDDAACLETERTLRAAAQRFGRNPVIAPLGVEALERFAAERGVDAGTPEARSSYAAELARRGDVIAWPPERNAPCWCGSGRKYKRCCALA